MPSMKSAIYVSGPVDDPSVKGDLRNVMMCIRDAILLLIVIKCNLFLVVFFLQSCYWPNGDIGFRFALIGCEGHASF